MASLAFVGHEWANFRTRRSNSAPFTTLSSDISVRR
jgi:hypothetical protein